MHSGLDPAIREHQIGDLWPRVGLFAHTNVCSNSPAQCRQFLFNQVFGPIWKGINVQTQTAQSNLDQPALELIKKCVEEAQPALLSHDEGRELISFAHSPKSWAALMQAARHPGQVELAERALGLVLEAGLNVTSEVQDRCLAAARIVQQTRANEFVRKNFGLGRMS